jgi:MFS family permease
MGALSCQRLVVNESVDLRRCRADWPHLPRAVKFVPAKLSQRVSLHRVAFVFIARLPLPAEVPLAGPQRVRGAAREQGGDSAMSEGAGSARGVPSGPVLFTLASGQFLMTLDSSVMNVSIATVAQDVGTTVAGIQTAITLYTLVMASLMITGGKLGQILGRKRAFAIGCIIYGCGSLTTALAKSLPVLIFGWSFLEGVGAALILPAIVALVASNFSQAQRPRAYGLVASAGAIAVAAGPLIGGLCTTYLSWRWVFVGEVVVVLVILLLTRRMADTEAERGTRLDLVGTGLSASGLGLVVFGVLRSSGWGFVQPKEGAPTWLGLSPVIWLVLAGGAVLRAFMWWEARQLSAGNAVLLDPSLLKNRVLRSGLVAFFFQYLLQAGLFFVVPLFLSVALGLSAIATGVRLLPLSATLLIAAVGIPRLFPHASPRRVVQLGFVALLLGIVIMMALLDSGAGPEIVTWPMLLAGLGIGALASQLGSVTVSSVPDEKSGEVGGVQNTMTNLGASLGTALAGAVLISVLSTSFLAGIQHNHDVPASVSNRAQTELSSGVPFVSDVQLQTALHDAKVPVATADAIAKENADARIAGLRSALALLAVVGLLAVFFSRRLPQTQPTGTPSPGRPASPGGGSEPGHRV